MDKRNLQSSLWIEDRVASLKDFCTASTKRLLTQYLLHKYKSKA